MRGTSLPDRSFDASASLRLAVVSMLTLGTTCAYATFYEMDHGTGLHSYGFGSDGYAYLGGFVAFEVLVIMGALARYRGQAAKLAVAVSSGALPAAH